MSGGLLMRLRTRGTNERLTGVVVPRTLDDKVCGVGWVVSVPKWLKGLACTVVKRIK